MAVAFGAAYSGEDGNATFAEAAAVVLAANDVADVTVTWRESAGQAITSVTFNGSATGCTQILAASGNGERIGIAKYRIVGVTGTAAVRGTISASAPAIAVDVLVLSGVDNASPVGTADTDFDAGGESGALSGTVTLSAGDLAVCAIVTGPEDSSASLTHNLGQDPRVAANSVAAPNITRAVSTEGGSGSVTSGYTWTGGDGGWARNVVVPYRASAGGGETITMDKWYAKIPDISRRKVGVVPSGTIGIKA